MASFFQTIHKANTNNKSSGTLLNHVTVNVRKVPTAEVGIETPKIGSFLSEMELRQAEREMMARRLVQEKRIKHIMKGARMAPKNGVNKRVADPVRSKTMAMVREEELPAQRGVVRRVTKKTPVWGEVPKAVRRERAVLEKEREEEYRENREKAEAMLANQAAIEIQRNLHRRVALGLRVWK